MCDVHVKSDDFSIGVVATLVLVSRGIEEILQPEDIVQPMNG